MPHKKTKSSPAKKKPQKVVTPQKSAIRKLKQSDYKSFRLTKRIKHPAGKLPSGFKLFKLSIRHLFIHKKIFVGILLVYLLLTVVLVRGFASSTDVGSIKQAIEDIVSGSAGELLGSAGALGALLGSSGATTEVAAAYQTMLFVIGSLAVIWALRQTHAKQKISVKDSFYKSMYPLVPFILTILIIVIQLLPLVVGNFLYAATISSGIAVTAIEKLLWSFLFFLLALWSIYMITASLFALYIVTLPDMRPISAIRSARGLVQFRRWTVMRKVLFLPFIVLLIIALIMVPIIMFITPVAEVVFVILSTFMIVVAHSYLYSLYRELLNE